MTQHTQALLLGIVIRHLFYVIFFGQKMVVVNYSQEGFFIES